MAKRPPIPFQDIARSALGFAESLVEQWLPGGKYSRPEYKATNPRRADANIGSFSVNVNTGKWGDFATDDAGNDLISLYAYINGLEQHDAAFEVADQIGFRLPDGCKPEHTDTKPTKQTIDPTVKPKAIKEPSAWHPIQPVPANADEVFKAHPVRGLPARTWTYYSADKQVLSHLFRFNTSDGGKETIPLTWCKNDKTNKHEWRWMQLPEPRPLYGLDRIAANPDAWVLLVSGEKCADAPLALMMSQCVVTWPGGDNGVDKVDWSPLAGRKIYYWPDCDAQRKKLTKAEVEQGLDPFTQPLLPEREQSGMKAMIRIAEKLHALDAGTESFFINIPAPGEKPSGWDIADAIDEGMTALQLVSFINNNYPFMPSGVPDPADPATVDEKLKSKSTPNSATAEDSTKAPTWHDYLLRSKGEIVACLANVYDILANDDRWKGVLFYDEFAQRVMKLKTPPYFEKNGETGEWNAQDDAKTAMWITRTYRLNVSPNLTAEAVENIARANVINPPKDWMLGLKWDGNKRVDTWLLDYMGVPLNDYSKRVARWFLMGMVKRVLEPGCKFDYCMVLEGSQGRKKSSALAALGGEWFGDTDLDLHNKDSMSALRGKMLYEFSELGSVARAEAAKQKSFLSRLVDEYRPVYGRREIRCPRQVVFSGTTNEWEWNKDPTGGRRFWPIMVEIEIDVDGIKEAREQLFAEAVVMVNEKLRYWPTTDEQARIFDPEQLKRGMPDSFVDLLYENVMSYTGEFSLAYAATEWLKMDNSKLTRDVQTRVGAALRSLGCTKFEKRNDKLTRYWYKPPVKNEVMSTASSVEDTSDVGF